MLKEYMIDQFKDQKRVKSKLSYNNISCIIKTISYLLNLRAPDWIASSISSLEGCSATSGSYLHTPLGIQHRALIIDVEEAIVHQKTDKQGTRKWKKKMERM